MAILNTTLSTGAGNIYASTGNTVVTTIYICNTDSATRTVNLYLIPSGGTAGTSNQIYKDLSITAGDTHITVNERLVMGNGDMIQANASVNSVVVATVSYAGV